MGFADKRLLTGLILTLLALGASIAANDFTGQARVGAVIVDDEGDPSVNQSTYNLYEGAALSLEDFQYRWDNGTRLYGDLKNITLNNRDLRATLTRRGLFGVSLRNFQYRRLYGGNGAEFTRRRSTSGEGWFQVHEYVRLSGGYSRTDRHGDQTAWFERFGSRLVRPIDYTHQSYHGGVQFKMDRRQLDIDYRMSDYTDNEGLQSDRSGSRFRVTGRAPIPRYENIMIYAGYQRYQFEVEERNDTLLANTGWLGGSVHFNQGYRLRANFIFDRARRTGDLSATDNLATTIYASKSWPRRAGVTVGYRHTLRDDALDELSGGGYSLSGWYSWPFGLTVKAGHGAGWMDVDAGRTLVGDTETMRDWLALEYKLAERSEVRFKIEARNRENDQIESETEYVRTGIDLYYEHPDYGTLAASYSYLDGEYEQDGGSFGFRDHVISGEVRINEYYDVSPVLGGVYVRSLEDTDVESFQVRLGAVYALNDRFSAEFKYTAHNFDDLADPAPVYSRYYTANVIELSLIRAF